MPPWRTALHSIPHHKEMKGNMSTESSTAGQAVPPFTLQSVNQLFQEPEDEIEYLVDRLLPLGGMSIIIAKPKTGKSSMGRQLCVAVADGTEFLGRSAEKAGVIYFALEEKRSEVAAHFSDMSLINIDSIFTYFQRVEPAEAIARLDATLSAHPETKLVVIDTLFKFARVKDANEYIAVNNALELLMEVARTRGVHVTCIHHAKKKETEDPADGTLGSTAINGGVDTIVMLSRDRQGIRTVRTEQRYGEDIPDTLLVWDERTRTVRLGLTTEEEQVRSAQQTQENIEMAMLEYIVANPNATQEDIYSMTSGRTSTRRAALRKLWETGVITRSGKGTKADPYRYEAAAVPVEA